MLSHLNFLLVSWNLKACCSDGGKICQGFSFLVTFFVLFEIILKIKAALFSRIHPLVYPSSWTVLNFTLPGYQPFAWIPANCLAPIHLAGLQPIVLLSTTWLAFKENIIYVWLELDFMVFYNPLDVKTYIMYWLGLRPSKLLGQNGWPGLQPTYYNLAGLVAKPNVAGHICVQRVQDYQTLIL